jgi:hypothetical protein
MATVEEIAAAPADDFVVVLRDSCRPFSIRDGALLPDQQTFITVSEYGHS